MILALAHTVNHKNYPLWPTYSCHNSATMRLYVAEFDWRYKVTCLQCSLVSGLKSHLLLLRYWCHGEWLISIDIAAYILLLIWAATSWMISRGAARWDSHTAPLSTPVSVVCLACRLGKEVQVHFAESQLAESQKVHSMSKCSWFVGKNPYPLFLIIF